MRLKARVFGGRTGKGQSLVWASVGMLEGLGQQTVLGPGSSQSSAAGDRGKPQRVTHLSRLTLCKITPSISGHSK